MFSHDDNPARNDERLSGLRAVGIRNLPIVASFPDLYFETLYDAFSVYSNIGFTEEDFIDFYVENIRRFKPLVAVGHDAGGEYGHGGHMLCAYALTKAVSLAADPAYHPESALKYGVWDTPKTYLHLYGEREIMIKIDEPLEYFDGKTAFQASQYGFSFHKSQHWTYFFTWLNGSAQAPIISSSQIKSYNPSKYGLYRTTVGDDSADAMDFFQNVTLARDIVPEPDEPDESENGEIIPDDAEPIGTISEKDASNNGEQWLLIAVIGAIGAVLLFLLLIIMRRKKWKATS
jgi:LmbE family N-acetylglucosaminyl deacetylase